MVRKSATESKYINYKKIDNMSNNNIELNSSLNPYDETPYESYPFAITSLYHLMTLGVLFGMNPVVPDKARVLELGCASGSNIIPHALNYPKANFLGVDLSKVQIDEANKHKLGLNLKNIEFRCCSITDIDESFGKFDYIICHGIISWVPDFVRDKIFEVCNKNLSADGIAYISYNTLPGWNTIKSIREMMLYHTNDLKEPKEKVTQARLLLDFVKDSLEKSTSAYSRVVNDEANLLAAQADNYLIHDHLEEENKQYYFCDFMTEAKKNNLQYLADSKISTMYLGNMPSKVSEKLKDVGDIVRTEQYMDFITNRRFRSTLLCHNSIKLNRIITNEDIFKFNVIFNIIPEKSLDEIDINNLTESLKFFVNGNKDASLSSAYPCMKAILYSFAENLNNPISVEMLLKNANKKLGGNKGPEVKNEFLNNAMRLVMQGYIEITLQKTRGKVNLDKPKLTALPLYQVQNTNNLWVTNLNHSTVAVSFFEKALLKYMNGENDKDKILEFIIQDIKSGVISANKGGKAIEDPNEIKNELIAAIDGAIKKAEYNALLSE